MGPPSVENLCASKALLEGRSRAPGLPKPPRSPPPPAAAAVPVAVPARGVLAVAAAVLATVLVPVLLALVLLAPASAARVLLHLALLEGEGAGHPEASARVAQPEEA